jgi:hypothetical protein
MWGRARRVGGKTYAVISGPSLPSERALRRLTRRHKNLLVEEIPAGTKSLSFLRPVIAELRRLIVATQDPLDVSEILNASYLTEFHAWCKPTSHVDLSTVPLQEFAGRAHDNWRSIRRVPTLKKLFVERGDFTWAETVAPLESLSLTNMRGEVLIPSTLGYHDGLTFLSLDGNRLLDVSGLNKVGTLRRLELAGFKRIEGAATLARLPALSDLLLMDIEAVDDLSWLQKAERIDRVTVAGRASWIADARRCLESLPPGWSFPPWAAGIE